MQVHPDRIIFKGDNNKYLTILRKDIDEYIILNSKPVIDSFDCLGLLPEFIQGSCTLIPIAKSVVWSYSVSKKLLIIIPQNKKMEYIYYRNVDKEKIISFICNIDSLRI
jgi:hypothetical protein